jgi:hypothetical protein
MYDQTVVNVRTELTFLSSLLWGQEPTTWYKAYNIPAVSCCMDTDSTEIAIEIKGNLQIFIDLRTAGFQC